LSDSWHKHINCAKCGSGIRHRLLVSTLQSVEGLSFDRLIRGKRVLHIAPETILTPILRGQASQYSTADLKRGDCDFRLDMSNMPEMPDGGFDAVIALDVLEHVPDYQRALEELRRVLVWRGYGILSVPQMDGLSETREDPSITTPEAREEYYGQWDHLRIFGDDFPVLAAAKGFSVIIINEGAFSAESVRRNVLSPPVLSTHPLATNFRKIFFLQKDA
jgi:SAM-dependent methyltransferase